MCFIEELVIEGEFFLWILEISINVTDELFRINSIKIWFLFILYFVKYFFYYSHHLLGIIFMFGCLLFILINFLIDFEYQLLILLL